MTIRGALYDILVSEIPVLHNNVWEPGVVDSTFQAPYAVIMKSSDVRQPERYAGTLHHYEIYPNVERKTLQALDQLSRQISEALDDRVFFVGEIPHYIEYEGASDDQVIDDWGLLTRALRFQIHELNWLAHDARDPNPVQAMASWGASKGYQTDPTEWKPTSEQSALYWRQGAYKEITPYAWGVRYVVTLHGHVINPDPVKRRQAVEDVVRELALDRRAYFPTKAPLDFRHISADSGYDSFGIGQIALDVYFGEIKKRERKRIKKIFVKDDGNVAGEVKRNDKTSKNE